LIVVVVMALGWYQTRQTMQRNQKNPTATQSPMNTQMQIMTKVMPIMIGVFTYFAPAGVGLYFVTSSAWRIGQQRLVLNKYYDDEKHPPKQFKHSADVDVESEVHDAGTEPKGNRTATKTNGAAGNGSQARPSPHTSRKKRKRRR
jgi:membrane protein insertase Oxa1/YidC/SpoIIIJ